MTIPQDVPARDPTASLGIILGEEQAMLDQSLERLFAERYGFRHRRHYQSGPESFSRDVWIQLAELGILGLPFGAHLGGSEGGPAELMVVMRAFGRALALEPYLATTVLGGGFVQRFGTARQRQELLPSLAAGELVLAAALEERGNTDGPAGTVTLARRTGTDFFLNGTKCAVLHGGQADKLIVLARTGNEGSLTLFVVDRQTPRVEIRDYPTADGLRAADIAFNDARVGADSQLGEAPLAPDDIEAVTDLAAAALAVEGVGCMDTLLAQTIDHMKTRHQFGRPIAQFQALRHRLADMAIHREQLRSLAERALLDAWSGPAVIRKRSVSAAKFQVGQSGRFFAQSAVQIFGGLGVTMELPAAHYAKRLTMIDFWLGDSAMHLRRFLQQ